MLRNREEIVSSTRFIPLEGSEIPARGRDLKIIAFYKIGTLTQSRPQVTDSVALVGGGPANL